MFAIVKLFALIGSISSTIIVLNPPDVRQTLKDPIEFGWANFGNIPFGKAIQGSASIDTQTDACKPLAKQAIKGEVSILIARRGGCDFVVKALNAQDNGHSVLIVVDDQDEQTTRVVMADDGQGAQVTIPCLFIGKRQGDILINGLYKPHPTTNMMTIGTVNLLITFPTNKLDKAYVHIGISLQNTNSFDFIHDFHRFWESLSSNITMDLIYSLYKCSSCIPNPKINQKFDAKTDDNCVGGGLYCTTHLSVNNVTIPGRELVLESLRQICVFKLHEFNWWRYMKHFNQMCLVEGDPTSESLAECSAEVLEELELPDQQTVSRCVSDSFNIQEDFDFDNEFHLNQPNHLLDKQMQLIQTSGLVYYPGAVINNVTFWGALKGSNVFEEICESLSTPPQICEDFNQSGELIFHNKSSYHQRKILYVMFTVAIPLIIFFVCLLFFYRRWAKKRMLAQMGTEVNSMVANYIQFNEQKGSK